MHNTRFIFLQHNFLLRFRTTHRFKEEGSCKIIWIFFIFQVNIADINIILILVRSENKTLAYQIIYVFMCISWSPIWSITFIVINIIFVCRQRAFNINTIIKNYCLLNVTPYKLTTGTFYLVGYFIFFVTVIRIHESFVICNFQKVLIWA